MSAEVNI